MAKKGRPKKRRGPAKRGKGRSKRRSYTRNPSAAGILSGTGIPGAAKSMLPMISGAMLAKLAQKRFGDKTHESSNWTWKDYAAGGIGSLVASIAARHLLRASAATSQKVLEGGLLILAFKAITQEIVPMSAAATSWLGEDGEQYTAGDLYQTDEGETYLLGENGEWTDITTYLPETTGCNDEQTAIGDMVVEPGPLGDIVAPPGPLGDAFDDAWTGGAGSGAVW